MNILGSTAMPSAVAKSSTVEMNSGSSKLNRIVVNVFKMRSAWGETAASAMAMTWRSCLRAVSFAWFVVWNSVHSCRVCPVSPSIYQVDQSVEVSSHEILRGFSFIA